MATKRQLFFCLQILLVKLIIVVVVMVNQACYVSSLANMFDSFDDTVHFAVLWPGRDGHDRGRDGVIKENLKDDQKVVAGNKQKFEAVSVTTTQQEQYQCVLPEWQDNTEEVDTGGSELSAHSLLNEVFQAQRCSLLMESYWTYELCHGKYLRQFHELRSKNGQVLKLTEYYLGYYDEGQLSVTPHSESVPKWAYNHIDYPYYGVEFVSGTPCDLTGGKPRMAEVIYLCNKEHEESAEPIFFSIMELSTCRYQAAVFTEQLCHNKRYLPKKKSVHAIKCFPKNESPRQPLMAVEHELLSQSLTSGASPDSETKESDFDDSPQYRAGDPTVRNTAVSLDEAFVNGFMSAEFCLQGKSSGWWQNELCYGEHVKQVHLEGGFVKQKVFLGFWDEERHKDWYTNAGKSRQSKSHVTHWYGDGDVCDVTGSPRHCQVRFKCIESAKPSQVTISLQEPTACSYIMTIEASFICTLLKHADQHGLFQLPSEKL